MAVFCLQWNLDGYFKHLHELQILINRYHPLVICLQETHFRPNHKVSLKNYSIYRQDYIDAKQACGGTAIFVHDSILSQPITTKSSLQTVSVSIKIPTISPSPFTLTSIYLPPHINVSYRDLQSLLDSLPSPTIICGDFNAHSHTWGGKQLNNRGTAVENLLLNNPNLLLLNTYKTPTHFCAANGSFSTIDLTLSATSLTPSLSWKTHPDLCDSDHFPIIISQNTLQPKVHQSTPKWILSKADWPLFTNLTSNTDLIPPSDSIEQDITQLTDFIIQAAERSIPKTTPSTKNHPVPWWSPEIKTALKIRNTALNHYKKTHNPSHLIEYKRLRAKARYLLRSAKKQSWISFVSSINEPVSCSTMWSNIKKLTGNKQKFTFPSLSYNNQTYQTPSEISELLAQSYTKISDNDNYDPNFITIKLNSEKKPIKFTTNKLKEHSLPYNQPITEKEVSHTITLWSKKSAPGNDQITSTMLQHLHHNTITHLTSLLNRIFFSANFPSQWKNALIIPLLKPLKDPTHPLSYRPISLLSALGKILEKIINNRLTWFLETNEILSHAQFGCRKKRSALMALADLDAQIHVAHAEGASLFSIFFDMENAFPRVWTYHICATLHQMGLRGPLPLLIKNFLNDRTFNVRVADTLSNISSQQNGIPQGSPLSGTLFLIAINGVTKIIPSPIQTILFADDLSVHLRTNYPNRALRILQDTIDKIHSWLSSKGFRISIQKTKFIHFQKPRTKPFTSTRTLNIENNQIPQVETIKALGLLFHTRHSWLPHIKATKAKCLRALNTIKFLSHPKYGCNRKILLTLYTTLVRSILDYGSPIYGLAPSTHLRLLDTIQNAALRTATGAFRTSPAVSLCADAGIPPLHYRRLTLTAKLLTSILQHPKTTTYNHIFHPPPSLHPDNNLRSHLERQLNRTFKFNILNPIQSTIPPWLFSPPTFNLSLAQYPKSPTSSSVYRSHFQELIHSFQQPTLCFTDGSKTHNKTGFAFSVENSIHPYRHRNTSSVFTAELQAIFNCLQHILSTTRSSHTPFLIISDSLAAFNAISNPSHAHPLVSRIQLLLETCSTAPIPVVLVWAPGHRGIAGNEEVDRAAKQATLQSTIRKSFLPSSDDLFHHINGYIRQRWFADWKSQRLLGNKLAQLKDTPVPWKSSNLPDKSQEIILTRLRIGHTRFTHAHLISHLMPLTCLHCNTDLPLTVDHLFECPHLVHIRNSCGIPHNRIAALTDDSPILPNIFSFLRHTNFLFRV